MSGRSKLIVFMTVIIGLVLIWTLTFGRSNGKPSVKPTLPRPVSLTDYADRDSKVVFTQDGRINSDQEHRSIRISIGRSASTLEVVQGYQNKVIQTNTFVNNTESYKTFLSALARSSFDRKRELKNVTDERGVCPTARRYVSEIIDNNEQKLRVWSADCQKGTAVANAQQILLLFQQQIPGYGNLVSKVQL